LRPVRIEIATWTVAIAAILGLAALIRFCDLGSRGLVYWDEGKFALEGVRLQALMAQGPAAGKAIGTAKPTHALLIALSFAVLGVRDWAPLMLSALCSVASVAVLVAIGTQLFDRSTGLLAGLFLAVSTYDVIYARSALSEADATLLFLLAALPYAGIPQTWPMARRLLPGFLAGLAFSTNYRMVIYLVTLVAFDLAVELRWHGALQAVRRCAAIR